MKKAIEHEIGTGNVYKDIGLDNADELLVQANLIVAMRQIINERGLKQVEVAELCGLSQGDVSMLTRGLVRHFSSGRIMQVLANLGRDVEIRIKPAPKRYALGRITVKAV